MSLCSGDRWKVKLALKDEADVLAWRKHWLDRAEANHRVRAGLIESMKHDLLLYVNLMVWQYNPRKVGSEVGPFVTWPFQDRAFPFIVQCIQDQVNLVCEKSRDMGLSWMHLIVADWLCRFHPHKKVLMVSRNQDAVESESSDSLFWKIDFMQQWLPDWIKGDVKRRKLYYGYPNGSSITGEASTGRAGVGGRATVIFVDEFAQIKEDWEVLHRTSDTSYCRIFNSTHLGLDTAFFKLCTDRDSFPESSWRHLVIHWTQHPEKRRGRYQFNPTSNLIEVLDHADPPPLDYPFVRSAAPVGGPEPGVRSPWYDRACGDKGSERAIAMDLDINPQGSVSQVFNPLRISYLRGKHCVPAYWVGELEYDHDCKPLRLTPRDDGRLKLWLFPRGDLVPVSRYTVGCDLALGTGATNSCVAVIDARLAEKVGDLTTPDLEPHQLARYVVALCRLFQDEEGLGAYLGWEMPGPGLSFAKTIDEIGYRHIYYYDKTEKQGPGIYSPGKEQKPGWWNQNDAKRYLIENYMADLQGEKYITHDEIELKECLMFKWSGDGRTIVHQGELDEDPSKARANHGDRVIGAGIAWMMAAGHRRGFQQRQEEEQKSLPGSYAWRRELRYNQQREEDSPWSESN